MQVRAAHDAGPSRARCRPKGVRVGRFAGFGRYDPDPCGLVSSGGLLLLMSSAYCAWQRQSHGATRTHRNFPHREHSGIVSSPELGRGRAPGARHPLRADVPPLPQLPRAGSLPARSSSAPSPSTRPDAAQLPTRHVTRSRERYARLGLSETTRTGTRHSAPGECLSGGRSARAAASGRLVQEGRGGHSDMQPPPIRGRIAVFRPGSHVVVVPANPRRRPGWCAAARVLSPPARAATAAG
jgi:hypothetical protein